VSNEFSIDYKKTDFKRNVSFKNPDQTVYVPIGHDKNARWLSGQASLDFKAYKLNTSGKTSLEDVDLFSTIYSTSPSDCNLDVVGRSTDGNSAPGIVCNIVTEDGDKSKPYNNNGYFSVSVTIMTPGEYECVLSLDIGKNDALRTEVKMKVVGITADLDYDKISLRRVAHEEIRVGNVQNGEVYKRLSFNRDDQKVTLTTKLTSDDVGLRSESFEEFGDLFFYDTKLYDIGHSLLCYDVESDKTISDFFDGIKAGFVNISDEKYSAGSTSFFGNITKAGIYTFNCYSSFYSDQFDSSNGYSPLIDGKDTDFGKFTLEINAIADPNVSITLDDSNKPLSEQDERSVSIKCSNMFMQDSQCIYDSMQNDFDIVSTMPNTEKGQTTQTVTFKPKTPGWHTIQVRAGTNDHQGYNNDSNELKVFVYPKLKVKSENYEVQFGQPFHLEIGDQELSKFGDSLFMRETDRLQTNCMGQSDEYKFSQNKSEISSADGQHKKYQAYQGVINDLAFTPRVVRTDNLSCSLDVFDGNKYVTTLGEAKFQVNVVDNPILNISLPSVDVFSGDSVAIDSHCIHGDGTLFEDCPINFSSDSDLTFSGNTVYAASVGPKKIIASALVDGKLISNSIGMTVYMKPQVADMKITAKTGSALKKEFVISAYPEVINDLSCIGLPAGIRADVLTKSLGGKFMKAGIFVAKCYANNGYGYGKSAVITFDITDPDFGDIASTSFVDVNSKNPYINDIGWAFSKKLIAECASINKQTKKFCPSGTVKVYEYINFLYKLSGSPKVNLPKNSPYLDMPKSSSISYKAAVWAKTKKIYSGDVCANKKRCFFPNQKVTKAIAVNTLFSSVAKPGSVKTKKLVADVSKGSKTGKSLSYLASKKVITPMSRFFPNVKVTRGYLVSLLHAFEQKVGKKGMKI
jgi:hypothetical protein